MVSERISTLWVSVASWGAEAVRVHSVYRTLINLWLTLTAWAGEKCMFAGGQENPSAAPLHQP